MNFIILDLEATCWQGNIMNRRQEVIELAAFSVNGYNEWNDRFQSFIRPKENPRLSAYCIELTGILQEQIDKSNRFEIVFERFQDWIESHEHPRLLCTWGSKDVPMLLEECRVYDLDCSFLPPAINLKQQFMRIFQLDKQVGLLKALQMSGFEFEGSHHRAEDDAFNTAKLFLHHLDQWAY